MGIKVSCLPKRMWKKSFGQGNAATKFGRSEARQAGNMSQKYEIDLDVASLTTEIQIYVDEKGHFSILPEYHRDVVNGPNVKAMAVALYSEGVMANDRIASFLDAVGGSVYNFCRTFSEKTQESTASLEEELLNHRVVRTNATGVIVNGEKCYIQNYSIENVVVYRAVKDKTIISIKKLRFLSKFVGTLVHDHETALYHFGTEHGEYNVHIIRYLKKNSEDSENSWSGEMISLLCEMNCMRKLHKEENIFLEQVIAAYEKRYREKIAKGQEENKETKYKYARKDEKKLLNRMKKYKGNHLLFLHDFEVHYDDNMSERDLRKAKNRKKMAGGFRKEGGHEMYCNILTVIETLKRRDMAVLENEKTVHGNNSYFLSVPESLILKRRLNSSNRFPCSKRKTVDYW